ncbi:unnamed protein product [Musa textilis]
MGSGLLLETISVWRDPSKCRPPHLLRWNPLLQPPQPQFLVVGARKPIGFPLRCTTRPPSVTAEKKKDAPRARRCDSSLIPWTGSRNRRLPSSCSRSSSPSIRVARSRRPGGGWAGRPSPPRPLGLTRPLLGVTRILPSQASLTRRPTTHPRRSEAGSTWGRPSGWVSALGRASSSS